MPLIILYLVHRNRVLWIIILFLRGCLWNTPQGSSLVTGRYRNLVLVRFPFLIDEKSSEEGAESGRGGRCGQPISYFLDIQTPEGRQGVVS